MDDLIRQFAELFDGNHAAVGSEDGGCIRVEHSLRWEGFIQNHLHSGGQNAIGVYPLVRNVLGEWIVKWGCIDWDDGEEESMAHARNVQTLLAQFGVTGWIERSRSKGVHLWIFCGDWTEAWIVRRGLLMACTLVDAPIREINPKSEGSDDPSFLSNYVRCPYPGWLVGAVSGSDRRVMLDDAGQRLGLRLFLHLAAERAGIGQLRKLAEAWTPPKAAVQQPVHEIGEDELADALSRCHGLTKLFIEEGPRPPHGRSEWLFILGVQLAKDGLHTFSECVALLRYADEQHGRKYADRRDAERRYEEIVEKGWAEV